jgi:hypothetical protein
MPQLVSYNYVLCYCTENEDHGWPQAQVVQMQYVLYVNSTEFEGVLRLRLYAVIAVVGDYTTCVSLLHEMNVCTNTPEKGVSGSRSVIRHVKTR